MAPPGSPHPPEGCRRRRDPSRSAADHPPWSGCGHCRRRGRMEPPQWRRSVVWCVIDGHSVHGRRSSSSQAGCRDPPRVVRIVRTGDVPARHQRSFGLEPGQARSQPACGGMAQAGLLLATARAAGVEPDTTVAWIGATAIVHGLAVLRFNMADFRPMGIACWNPMLVLPPG
jgi:hypothetical protein